MIVSILTIGDEICIGQVTNTNAAWIAEQFTLNGAQVLFHSVIPDNLTFIKSEVYRLWEYSDVIIATGGLGPTHDDITKKALLKLFNDKLIFSEIAYKNIEKFFKARGREITERNRDQAMLPSQCVVIPNPVGTASGMKFERKGKLLYSLPGVPIEMKTIITESILPELLDKMNSGKRKYFKTFHTCGIPESTLADLIDVENNFEKSVSIAFLPSLRGVRLRFGIEKANQSDANRQFNDIKNILIEKANDFIVGEDNENLVHTIHQLLIKNNKTISVAESCTAGLLGAELSSISGSSKYFLGGVQTYSNNAKISLLNISDDLLNTFGAVSKETAIEMARNVRLKFNSDFGLSITGIAGPEGGTIDKPVGTIWIGISDTIETVAIKYNFGSTRTTNRDLSVTYALYMLFKKLTIENKTYEKI